jgi:hypothetical protein
MSSFFLPPNTSLQLSDNNGNIVHQGVLGSNVAGSTLLTTFPTTSTGNSLGHYHYTESTTNALQFLNASGSGIGGHQLWASNDTYAPIKLFDINTIRAIIDTSLRNTSNKTILDLTNNQLTLTDALGTSQTVLSTSSLEMSNDPDGVKLGYTNQAFYAFTPANDTRSNLYAGILQQGNPSDLSNLTPTYLQINKRDNTLTSTLNNTSLNITNTTTTKTAILTDSNLTFNGVSYAQNQVVPTLIYSSPLIYADGIEPANGLGIRNTYGYSGWFFQNSHGTGGKINWYFPAQTQTATTVADLKGIAISFFNGQTVSNDDTLFLTVLTNPTGNNDYAPSFFHSSMTYVFNQAITPIANTNYQGVCIVDKNLVPFNFETQIQFEPSTVNNPRGTYAQTDTILAVVIGTNSASVKNNVELVVNKLNLIYSNFTQSYLLVPP